MERCFSLLSIVAAHPGHQIYGRTRLQKTVKLLQSLGLGTGYPYMNYFYGPYSEALQADVRLLELSGRLREDLQASRDGSEYYVITALDDPNDETTRPFAAQIGILSKEDPVVLELAATYQAFRELGLDHDRAIQSLRHKKGEKCAGGREQRALGLLGELGLLEKPLRNEVA